MYTSISILQTPQSSVKTFLSLPQIPLNPFAVKSCSQPQSWATIDLLSVSDTILNNYKFIISFTHHLFIHLFNQHVTVKAPALCQALN